MNWHRSRPPAIFTLLRLVSLHLLALPSPASRCAAGPRREHRQPVPAAGCPVPRGRGRGTRRVGGCAARPRSPLAAAPCSEAPSQHAHGIPHLHPSRSSSPGLRRTRRDRPAEETRSGSLGPLPPTDAADHPLFFLKTSPPSLFRSFFLPACPRRLQPGASACLLSRRLRLSVHPPRSSLPFPPGRPALDDAAPPFSCSLPLSLPLSVTSAGIPGLTGASSLSGPAAGSSAFIFPGFNLILPPQLPRPLQPFPGAIPCVRVGVPIAPPCPLPVCLRVLGVVARVRGMLWLPVCPCASRSVWRFVTVSQLGQEPWRGGGSIPGCLSPPPRACAPLSPCPVAAWPRRVPARPHRCSVRLPPAAPGCPPCPAPCPGATVCGDSQDSDPRGVSATGKGDRGQRAHVKHPRVPGAHRDKGLRCVRSSRSRGCCGDRAVPAIAVGRGQGDLLPCPKGARPPAGSGTRAGMLVGCSHRLSRQRPSGAGTAQAQYPLGEGSRDAPRCLALGSRPLSSKASLPAGCRPVGRLGMRHRRRGSRRTTSPTARRSRTPPSPTWSTP